MELGPFCLLGFDDVWSRWKRYCYFSTRHSMKRMRWYLCWTVYCHDFRNFGRWIDNWCTRTHSRSTIGRWVHPHGSWRHCNFGVQGDCPNKIRTLLRVVSWSRDIGRGENILINTHSSNLTTPLVRSYGLGSLGNPGSLLPKPAPERFCQTCRIIW